MKRLRENPYVDIEAEVSGEEGDEEDDDEEDEEEHHRCELSLYLTRIKWTDLSTVIVDSDDAEDPAAAQSPPMLDFNIDRGAEANQLAEIDQAIKARYAARRARGLVNEEHAEEDLAMYHIDVPVSNVIHQHV